MSSPAAALHVTMIALAIGAITACVPVAIPFAIQISTDDLPFRPAPATATCPVPARSAQDAAVVLTQMNAERARAGLGALRLSAPLTAIAQQHACDNAAHQSYSHNDSNGATLAERMRRNGFKSLQVAENIALGNISAAQVVPAWMTSSHHAANILLPNITVVGIAQADGPQSVWVVDFARLN